MSKSPFDSLDTSLLRSTKDETKSQEKAKQITTQLSQPINRSTEQSTHSFTSNSGSRIMDKPRGFYITERLNQRIDEAVRYFQEKHGLKKVDRSIVVTALLENESNWTDEALDLLVDRIISQLTKRLVNR